MITCGKPPSRSYSTSICSASLVGWERQRPQVLRRARAAAAAAAAAARGALWCALLGARLVSGVEVLGVEVVARLWRGARRSRMGVVGVIHRCAALVGVIEASHRAAGERDPVSVEPARGSLAVRAALLFHLLEQQVDQPNKVGAA